MSMASEILVSSVQNNCEQGNFSACELEYYMTEKDLVMNDYRCSTYGIKILKRMDNKVVESQIVEDISTYSDFVKGLLDRVVRGKVTPITLTYIVEDNLGV